MTTQFTRPSQAEAFNAEIEPVLNQLMGLCERYDINMVAFLDVDRYNPTTQFIRAYHISEPVTSHMRKFTDLFEAVQKQRAVRPETFIAARYTRKRKK
jgi:hypothetical protein